MKRKNIEQINEEFPRRFPDKCGSEALIFYLKHGVYKEFSKSTPIDTLKRKEEKLLGLEQHPELQQYYPEIRYLIDEKINEYIRGYIMEPVRGKTIRHEDLSFHLKMKALNDLRNILSIFRNNGYLYLDIRHPNIRIDSNENPILLDIDSILQIDNPTFDCTPTDIKKYLENGGKVNTNTQILMFNIFSQEALKLNEYMVDLTDARILRELDSSAYDSAADHEYLMDHLKRR